MARLILIHGAWGNASAWDDLIPLLTAAGHDVTALTLPGHSGDSTPPDQVGLNDYAHAIADAVDDQDTILIGHSMGGMAISAAAELIPERIIKLIYICAFLPKDGDSLLSLIKRQPLTIGKAVQPGPVPGTTVLDPEIAAPFLFQDATPSQRSKGIQQLGAQPNDGQTDRIHVTAQRFGSVQKAYILCEQDATLLPPLQASMAAPLTPHHLDTGHFPQLTAPKALADVLLGMLP